MNSLSASKCLAGILLVGLAASQAQNSKSNVLRWNYGAPNAVTDVTHSAKVEGLKTDNVNVYVAMFDIQDTEFNHAWVQVVNHGNTPIQFDPESAFLKDDIKVSAEQPEKAADRIQRIGEAKAQELASPPCTTMNSGGNGSGVSASASLACQPLPVLVEKSKEIATLTSEQAQWIRNHAMKPTTLAPGEQVVGAIVFKKGKKPTSYMLAVPVAGKTFEFPVNALNKISSYD
jgi:hypothetical protein